MSKPNDNPFASLVEGVDWMEPPAIELSEWRVRLPVIRIGGLKGGALQIEWMVINHGSADEPKYQGTMLVSFVDNRGRRPGDEACMGVEQVRALRALLNRSCLPDDDLRQKDSTRVEPFEGLDGDQENVEVAPLEDVRHVFDGGNAGLRRLFRQVVDAERQYQSVCNNESAEELLCQLNLLHDALLEDHPMIPSDPR